MGDGSSWTALSISLRAGRLAISQSSTMAATRRSGGYIVLGTLGALWLNFFRRKVLITYVGINSDVLTTSSW